MKQPAILSSREFSAYYERDPRSMVCIPTGRSWSKSTELRLATSAISGVSAPAISTNVALLTGGVKTTDPLQQNIRCEDFWAERDQLLVEGRRIPVRVKQTISVRYEVQRARGVADACVEMMVDTVEVEFGRFVLTGESTFATTNGCGTRK